MMVKSVFPHKIIRNTQFYHIRADKGEIKNILLDNRILEFHYGTQFLKAVRFFVAFA